MIRRPDWPNPDKMSGLPVYEHAIETVAADRPVSHVFSILPTSPCRHPDDFDQTLAAYTATRRQYPDCREIITVCADPETMVFHRDGPRIQVVLFDKHGEHLVQGPNVEFKDLSWWRDMYGALRTDDEETTTEKGLRFRQRMFYYRIGRWYQRWDVDDQETFELNEFLFEHYILKGRGSAVYEDYKLGGSR